MKTFYTILAVIALGLGLALIVSNGMDKSEIVDCNKLVAQAEEYKSNGQFYITGWQKDMCDAHGIVIDAPVK